MTPDLLSAFESRLTRMKQELLDQIKAQRNGASSRVEATAQARDVLQDDERLAAVEMELNMALGDREMVELNEIDATLMRLAQGRYGECIDCGAHVAEARLLAFPTASRCLSCQTKLENVHGHLHFSTL
jgi:DnaK suppressor protein